MSKPTLDELYALMGAQPAQYLDDYLAEHGAYAIPCGKCGKMTVVTSKPARHFLSSVRCGACWIASGERMPGVRL